MNDAANVHAKLLVFQECLSSLAARVPSLADLPALFEGLREDDTFWRWRTGKKKPRPKTMRHVFETYWRTVRESAPLFPADAIAYQREFMIARFDNRLTGFLNERYYSIESNYQRAVREGDRIRMVAWGHTLARCMMTKYAMAPKDAKPDGLAAEALRILRWIYEQRDRDRLLGDLVARFKVTLAMAEYNVVEFQLRDVVIRKRLARVFIELGLPAAIDDLIRRMPADEVLLHDAMKVGAVLMNEPEQDFEKWTREQRVRLEDLYPQYSSPHFDHAPLRRLSEDEIVMIEERRIYD